MSPGADPLDLTHLQAALGAIGVPGDLVGPDVWLDTFIAEAGEPAFAALLLHIEAWLPEPFPVDLIAQIDTLGDLLGFAHTKHTRGHRPS